MKKIIVGLLATATVFAVTGAAHADTRDYDSLTREQAIEALKIADASLEQATGEADIWRQASTDQWHLTLQARAELYKVTVDARFAAALGDETARHWQQRAVGAEGQVVTLRRRVDRKDATISRLRAKLASR